MSKPESTTPDSYLLTTPDEILRDAAHQVGAWLAPLRVSPTTSSTVKAVLAQYYFFNRAFVYGIIRYSGRLSEALQQGGAALSGMTQPEVEDILATVAKIAADECQAGGVHAGRHLHHNLLLRMGPKVGLSLAELQSGDVHQTPETALLVDTVERHFNDRNLLVGLATVSVVEGIALPMVTYLREILGGFKPAEAPPYSAHELEHLDMHIDLEVHHAADSRAVYEQVSLNRDAFDELIETVQTTLNAFTTFWGQFPTG
ncbi:MAG: hypothetical protein HOP28_06600 [Gemmatimonadales bacterium]|nr:hypothetical protein [Gemmatimonadales bacterium]